MNFMNKILYDAIFGYNWFACLLSFHCCLCHSLSVQKKDDQNLSMRKGEKYCSG